MSEAVRVGDLTAHGTPIQGQGSPDVFIGNMKAWRAIPADVGGGLEEASKQVKAIMDKFPSLPSPSDPSQVATKDLTEIFQKMLDTATKAEAASGMCGAMAGVQSAFMSFQPTALSLLATYTSAAAAPAPGAEVAARLAFTAAFQAGLGTVMSAAVTAIAGSWDMNNCPATIPGPPPHGPGLVTEGCKTIFINKMPAVVKGHKIIEASGGPNTIQVGCSNVFFGDKAPAGKEDTAKDSGQVAGQGSAGRAGLVSHKDEGKGSASAKGAPASQPIADEVEMQGSYLPTPVNVLRGYVVPDVLLIPQIRNMGCWFASAQMLIDWRRRKANGTPLVNPDPSQVQTSVTWEVNDHGITNPLVIQLAKLLGLKPVDPQSLTLRAVESLLRAHGPLWTNGTSHIVVIAGVDYDNRSLLVYDPWPPGKGKIEWREYAWYLSSPNPDSRDTGADVRAVFLRLP